MPDREKVINGLESCVVSKTKCFFNRNEMCPYFHVDVLHCEQELMRDAIALLKEQEAVEPIPPTDESDLWRCGNCNHQLFRCTHQRYCDMCGQAVKWE
jgi:hypothetical protein